MTKSSSDSDKMTQVSLEDDAPAQQVGHYDKDTVASIIRTHNKLDLIEKGSCASGVAIGAGLVGCGAPSYLSCIPALFCLVGSGVEIFSRCTGKGSVKKIEQQFGIEHESSWCSKQAKSFAQRIKSKSEAAIEV